MYAKAETVPPHSNSILDLAKLMAFIGCSPFATPNLPIVPSTVPATGCPQSAVPEAAPD